MGSELASALVACFFPCKGLFKSNGGGTLEAPSSSTGTTGLIVKGKLGARIPGFSCGGVLDK
jgi:hypothetical protein